MHYLIIFISAIPLMYGGLFPVLNPLGYAFIFFGLTSKLTSDARRALAKKIAINTFILLTGVLWFGELFLAFFGIPIGIVEVGGGLVISYLGWETMNQKTDQDNHDSIRIKNDADASSQAFFPLTMPMTAGPGAIAVSLTIGAHMSTSTIQESLVAKLGAMFSILLAAITVYFCYAYSDRLTKKLGTSITTVIIKLSAFIIFCIGLTISWHGLQEMSVSNPLS